MATELNRVGSSVFFALGDDLSEILRELSPAYLARAHERLRHSLGDLTPTDLAPGWVHPGFSSLSWNSRRTHPLQHTGWISRGTFQSLAPEAENAMTVALRAARSGRPSINWGVCSSRSYQSTGDAADFDSMVELLVSVACDEVTEWSCGVRRARAGDDTPWCTWVGALTDGDHAEAEAILTSSRAAFSPDGARLLRAVATRWDFSEHFADLPTDRVSTQIYEGLLTSDSARILAVAEKLSADGKTRQQVLDEFLVIHGWLQESGNQRFEDHLGDVMDCLSGFVGGGQPYPLPGDVEVGD